MHDLIYIKKIPNQCFSANTTSSSQDTTLLLAGDAFSRRYIRRWILKHLRYVVRIIVIRKRHRMRLLDIWVLAVVHILRHRSRRRRRLVHRRLIRRRWPCILVIVCDRYGFVRIRRIVGRRNNVTVIHVD